MLSRNNIDPILYIPCASQGVGIVTIQLQLAANDFFTLDVYVRGHGSLVAFLAYAVALLLLPLMMCTSCREERYGMYGVD